MAGLAGGADAAYIHEEKFGIKDLMKVIHFRSKKKAKKIRFFLMNSHTWVLYTYLIQLHFIKGKK